MIIGISGKSGSGKDLVAGIIQYLIWKKRVERGELLQYYPTFQDFIQKNVGGYGALSGWKVVKFADKLKDIICLLTGCTREDLENQDFKKQILPEEWWFWTFSKFGLKKIIPYDKNGYDETKYRGLILKKPTYRYLLTYIGTDLIRDRLHPNAWVIATLAEYKNSDNWLISDLRFNNELKAIKDKGGITIRVNRDNRTFLNTIPHASETELDNAHFDYYLNNNSSIEALIVGVNEILIRENIL